MVPRWKDHRKKETDDLIEIKADLKVGKKFLNQTYTSFVLLTKILIKLS